MTPPAIEQNCPDDELMPVLQGEAEIDARLETTARLLRRYPSDPRLPFLQGSLLASLQRYDEARVAMAEAVRIAPDYAIARFQLGLLQLSSGDAAAATSTWERLELLAADEPLRLFAEGLNHLARDEFASAVALLDRGIAANHENPALNADMGLIIDAVRHANLGEPSPGEQVSGAHMLLQQYALKPTRH